jgi:hypothetical protein
LKDSFFTINNNSFSNFKQKLAKSCAHHNKN